MQKTSNLIKKEVYEQNKSRYSFKCLIVNNIFSILKNFDQHERLNNIKKLTFDKIIKQKIYTKFYDKLCVYLNCL